MQAVLGADPLSLVPRPHGRAAETRRGRDATARYDAPPTEPRAPRESCIVKAFRDDVVDRLAMASGLAPDLVDKSLGVPDLERGDFAFPCFPLAKERKAPPPRIAAEIAAKVALGGRVVKAEAVGPYVNVTVDRARLTQETLEEVAAKGAAFGSGTEGDGKTVVIDFSSPNVAKPLAFHHLRSTMIGNSLVRLYQARGWRTVGVNHLGDWGTGFGKLLLALELWGDEPLVANDPRALNDFYVRINAASKTDPTLEDRARAWFKRLEDGDAGARALWARCVALSMVEFTAVYERLGVAFDHVTGESFYEDKMPAVIADLRARGLLEESEGALVVRVEEPGDEKPMPPCLIVKSDGATLYATRDLAAAQYRHDTFHFDRSPLPRGRRAGHALRAAEARAAPRRAARGPTRSGTSPSACSSSVARGRAPAPVRSSCSPTCSTTPSRRSRPSSGRRTPTSPTRPRWPGRSASARSSSAT